MATGFSRTFRSLNADGFGRSAAVITSGVLVLAGWSAWCLMSRLTVHEITSEARLEVGRATYAVQSPLVGRVTRSELVLGRIVQEGEVLLEIESEGQKLELGQEQARMAALGAQAGALQSQIDAEQTAREAEEKAARTAVEQALAAAREAQAPARYSGEEMQRLARLRNSGLISEREYSRGVSEAQKHTAGAEQSEIGVKRLEQEQRTRQSDREARLRALRAELARIEGESTTAAVTLRKLQYEVERRYVRAPAAGRIGELKALRTGSVVAEGEQLAAIIPDENLKVVAQFTPPAALGRIRAGQPARMRMHGFPWAQYGLVEATVASVAQEVRDGSVKVELALKPSPNLRVPLQHGMPGDLEIDIESISPAALIMRTAAGLLAAPRTSQHSRGAASAQVAQR